MNEQSEAHDVERIRRQFPKWRWLGVLSRRERRLRLFLFSWIRGSGPGWGAPDNYNASLTVGIEWKPEDLWIGAFWKGGRNERWLWVCFLPCLPVRFHYQRVYGGWIMSPYEPKVDPAHRRRWWQWFKVV